MKFVQVGQAPGPVKSTEREQFVTSREALGFVCILDDLSPTDGYQRNIDSVERLGLEIDNYAT